MTCLISSVRYSVYYTSTESITVALSEYSWYSLWNVTGKGHLVDGIHNCLSLNSSNKDICCSWWRYSERSSSECTAYYATNNTTSQLLNKVLWEVPTEAKTWMKWPLPLVNVSSLFGGIHFIYSKPAEPTFLWCIMQN